MFFRFFIIISLWKRALHLNKLESALSKDALCQVWLKLACAYGEEGFVNFDQLFSLFHNYIHLEKGGALQFEHS